MEKFKIGDLVVLKDEYKEHEKVYYSVTLGDNVGYINSDDEEYYFDVVWGSKNGLMESNYHIKKLKLATSHIINSLKKK